MKLELSRIQRDGGTQPRAATDFGIVEEYAQAMGEGATFPPVVVFFDGSAYWLADGFHRWHAHEVCGLVDIECDVRQGSVRDAILHSVGVNAAHGMRRTNADKRRSVTRLLDDQEWSQWSDREIARRCGVSNKFVGTLRPAPEPDTVNRTQYESRTFTHPKTGQPTQMRTGNIGGGYSPPPRPAPIPEVERIQSLGASRERAEQIVHDGAHGWISSAVWEIERQMAALPDDPVEAARKFPAGHRHTLSVDRLFAFAEWFGEFADEMRNIERAPNVAAE